ncbi:large ribosomal subunit protein mL45 [Pelodytes ibericus]
MAASIRMFRALGEQGLTSILNPTRLATPIRVLPVRTKKRYFIPPAVNNKQKSISDMVNKARAAGVVAPHEIQERPINISCTAGIFDAYVPPEGDARLSALSREGVKQRTHQLKQTATSQLAVRTIKQYDNEFSTKTFPEKAQEIFIMAHACLTQFDRHKLHALVTERCYPEMVRGNRYRTLRWTFLESLEPPRVVQVRCPDMITKGNLYGQVTVRMHTKQSLVIYDRFGRIQYGSEEPRDVLEYVVFERHMINPYGTWRMHGKIVPSWAPSKEPIIKTVVLPGPQLKPWEELEDLTLESKETPQQQWYK